MVLVSEGLLKATVIFKGGGKPGCSRERDLRQIMSSLLETSDTVVRVGLVLGRLAMFNS